MPIILIEGIVKIRKRQYPFASIINTNIFIPNHIFLLLTKSLICVFAYHEKRKEHQGTVLTKEIITDSSPEMDKH